MTMIAALSLLALATNAAPVKPVSASAKLLADYRIALEHDDADALTALFSPDAELADGNMVANGKAEIRALYVGAFAQGLSGSRLETRIDSERLLAPTVRFVRGVSRITPAAAGGQVAKPFCARFIATITLRNGLWRIATFSESALACGTAFP
ncbi:MAG: hypothetical protein B7Y43_07945 [Sphingomonas sp. 28-62-20]|uniref:YybH family protein n=1 Tax=Sphingomonas sp. 28-62-20 TaxID=1970433 RepID=UPI000BCC75BC|nr:MAG: hypothetical protein B7Y43_07945 [Sphingomonas sp. 28-62-20]